MDMGQINFIRCHRKSLKPLQLTVLLLVPAFAALYIFSLAKKNLVRRHHGCFKIKLIKATGITASFCLTLLSHYRLNTFGLGILD